VRSVSSRGTRPHRDDGPGGSASFLSSATLGITVPPGAMLVPASGTVYLAAVPEPESWLLLVAGLALLAVAVRRARSRR
jgi:PEP-CTERM motif